MTVGFLVFGLAGFFVVSVSGLMIAGAAWAILGGGNRFQGDSSILIAASLLSVVGAVVWYRDRTWKVLGVVSLSVVGLTLPGAMIVWGSPLGGEGGADPGVSFHDDCDRRAYEETRTNYLEAANRDFDEEYQSVHRLCHTFSS